MILNINKIRKAIGLISYAFKQYSSRLILLGFLGILAGFFEAFGIGIVIPLFSTITGTVGTGSDKITQVVHKIFYTLNISPTPVTLIVFMVGLFILKALVQFIVRILNAMTVAEFEKDMRKKLFYRTIHSTWPYLMKQKVGYLENIIMYDVERTASIFNYVSGTILLITSFVMYASVAVSISIPITLITIGIGTILFILLKPILYKVKKNLQEVAIIYKKISHHVAESLIGAKIIKSNQSEEHVIKIAKQDFNKLRKLKIKSALYRQATSNIIEPLSFIMIGIIFLTSYKSPGFEITAFAVVIYLIQKMFSFIQSMQAQVHTIYEFIPYMETIYSYRRNARKNQEEDTGTNNFSFTKELEFKNVGFYYENKKNVLTNKNFSITKGSIVGLVGASGAGKTTTVDLILRMLTPQEGEILIDNQNIGNIKLSEWRKNIGYVPQDVFLFNDTIENNITLFDETITHDMVVEASKIAQIHETIMSLPEQYNANVGERGLSLSGGQRQRITLARALVRNPQILILDEATSAVDTESEEKIKNAIDHLKNKMTIIIIAHRQSTIENADQVIELK